MIRSTFYGLKTCDTCRKAQAALSAAGIAYSVVDLRTDGLPPETLSRWVEKLGSGTLVNRRSTTWRGLSEEDRARAAGPEAIGLLTDHPTLIKRPVIETPDGAVRVGWSTETARALGA